MKNQFEQARAKIETLIEKLEEAAEKVEITIGERPRLPQEIFLSVLAEGREEAFALRGRGCAAVASQLMVRILDTVFRALYQMAQKAAPSPPLCLIATGGYGRGELSLFSDIDVALIPSEEEGSDELVGTLYHLIFDLLPKAGLDIGYAYRPLEDFPRWNHITLTALLESRLLAGDEGLYEHFMTELRRAVDPLSFLLEKVEERRELTMVKGETVYLVEPNIKDGAGGLRDAHSAIWMCRGIFGLKTKDPLRELASLELLPAQEEKQVREALGFLADVRHCLHAISKRKNDLLLTEHQEEISRWLGYVAVQSRHAGPRGTGKDGGETPAVERFMQDYYRHAACLHSFSQKMRLRCWAQTILLDYGLSAKEGMICPADVSEFLSRAENLLAAFSLAHKYNLPMNMELRFLIEEKASLVEEKLRSSPQAAQHFLALFEKLPGLAERLRAMRELGVLNRYLPELGELEGLIPYDPSHQFTVGEHSIRVLEELEYLSEDEGERFGTIIRELPDPQALFLAALLHDMGKVKGRGQHPSAGARVARRILERLGIEKQRTERICFLIENHLAMARTSRLRDLNVEKTILDFANLVGDKENLDMLYLLTYADSEAIGPRGWTDVGARSLDDLYGKALRKILSRLPEEDVLSQVPSVIDSLVWQITLKDVSKEAIRQHCEQMPASYVLNVDVADIAMHISFIRQLQTDGPVVHFFDPEDTDFTEVTVCTFDEPEPGLFSKITGSFFANGINIQQAEVFTRASRPPTAIDTFLVDFNGQQLDEGQKERLERDLRRVLSREVEVEELLLSKRKKVKGGIALEKLTLNNQISDEHTVVEFRAPDQIGLLYLLTKGLSECGLNIHTAKVTTWVGKAEDVFYVTDAEGQKVPEETRTQMEEQLRRVLSRK